MSFSNSDRVIYSEDAYSRGQLILINSEPTIEFVDNYEHLDAKLEYILENIIYEPNDGEELLNFGEFRELKKLFNTILQNSCNCIESDCKSKSCHHSGNYIMYENQSTKHKELVLNAERPSKHVIYECSVNCKCLATCQNRLVQYGPHKNLQIIPSRTLTNEQLSVIVTAEIPKGAFVCEYAGEILTKTEAKRRNGIVNRLENRMNYVICLNEYQLTGNNFKNNVTNMLPIQTFIDPSRKGNIGRYLNHSCNPNCEIISIRTDSPIPKLGIFTKRQIQPFEELCFHYGEEETDKIELSGFNRIPCLCGEENCKKYLPNLEF